MTEIVISGAMGRMGRAVLEAAIDDPEANVVGLTESPDHPALGQTLEFRQSSIKLTGELLGLGAGKKPVLVDFSVPQAAVARAREAAKLGWPLVTGTTGLDVGQRREIEKAADKIALVHAANFSAGIALLRALARTASQALGGDADVEIIEIHHNLKKDAPSGTALALAEAVSQGGDKGRKLLLAHGRSGVAQRRKGEIGVHAVRAGDVTGDHTVLFAMPGERLELTHRAHGRATFARGALRAAHFVAKAKPGLYGIDQVLGLRASA